MRLLHLLLLASLGSLTLVKPARAFDTTTQGVTVSGYVTSQITSAPFDNKLILAARDDAAVFVASNGSLRGVHLEAVLQALRQSPLKLNASDLELAEAILVQ